MKEETAHRGAINVGALTTLRTFAPTDWKSRMMVINLDWLAPYQGAYWDEQREQLETKHHASRMTVR
jgi:hypothetical protein